MTSGIICDCVCWSVCPPCERNQQELSTPNLVYTYTLWQTSACIDPEVKRSKVKFTQLTAGVGAQVDISSSVTRRFATSGDGTGKSGQGFHPTLPRGLNIQRVRMSPIKDRGQTDRVTTPTRAELRRGRATPTCLAAL